MKFKRNKIIIGNWKMFKDMTSANNDFLEYLNLVVTNNLKIEVGIAAPSVFLSDLAKKTQHSVTLFAQNAHWADEGAFTGEISIYMLKSIQVFGSLVAHSERRQMFGETNHTAGARVGALIRASMKAILCVGETLEQRENGKLREVLTTQLKEAIAAAKIKNIHEFIGSNPNSPLFSIAYEPVWAIGTGKSATSAEAQDAHFFIRQVLADCFDKESSLKFKIIYGGSVKINNINEYMSCNDIDGALVGGASLIPKDFFELCAKVNE